MTNFSASECITFGWETFKKRPWFLVGAMAAFMAVLWIIGVVLGVLGGMIKGFSFITMLANWAVQVFAGMGMISFLLKAHDNVEQVSLHDFWHPGPFWNYLGATALQMLAVIGGLFLLIVPGIIFALMFMFTGYAVVEMRKGPIEALKESARITKGKKWELFLLLLLTIGVTILGAICLLVGLFVAIPVVALAQVHAYRLLVGSADAVVPVAPVSPEVPSVSATPATPSLS